MEARSSGNVEEIGEMMKHCLKNCRATGPVAFHETAGGPPALQNSGEKYVSATAPTQYLWALFLSIIVSTTSLFAANPEDVFNQANTAFVSGKYADAIRDYESLTTQSGYSAALLYNLGNAYYRNGQIGHAILNYERAFWLDPNDADIRANLQFVQRAAGFFEADRSWWQTLSDFLRLDSWTWLFVISLALLCAAFILRMTKPTMRAGLRSLIWACLLLLGVSATSIVTRMLELNRAVVLVSETPLRIAPLDPLPASPTLPAGAILEIQKQQGLFFCVRTEDGRSGWVLMKQVERVVSPISATCQ